MTELYIQKDMAHAMAQTESMVYVASQIFGGGKGGKSSAPTQVIDTADGASAFARMLNG